MTYQLDDVVLERVPLRLLVLASLGGVVLGVAVVVDAVRRVVTPR